MKKVTPPANKVPSKAAILRAVASSTAIETGKPIAVIEDQLRNPGKFARLKLAR
jgi:hypothetical protein